MFIQMITDHLIREGKFEVAEHLQRETEIALNSKLFETFQRIFSVYFASKM